MQIAIVDDNSTNLAILTRLVSRMADVTVRGYVDPMTALAEFAANPVDLIVVDYQMPGMDGVSFIRRIRAMGNDLLPIIMVTADLDQHLRIEAVEAGATDFLTKPVNPVELRARAGNLLDLRRAQISLADRARTLEDDVAAATRHLLEREEEVIARLARAIEYRDGETGDHVTRVGEISRIIGQELGLDPHALRNLWLAAPLHDIGKIGVPDAILNKPGRLDTDELAKMRAHVEIGGAILSGSSTDLVQIAQEIAACHHEKWDGTGYPRGISGQSIPLPARITAIADVFDALCSDRPYKRAWPIAKAHAEILRGAGTHFDPLCVAAFQRGWPRIVAVMNQNLPEAAA
jgi:putative two-component system response regulator